MSDIREARAVRYLLDAVNDISIIGPALEEGIYSMAIFHSQQASEKSAKACLSLLDILITDEHIYTDYLVKFVILESKDLNIDFLKLLSSFLCVLCALCGELINREERKERKAVY